VSAAMIGPGGQRPRAASAAWRWLGALLLLLASWAPWSASAHETTLVDLRVREIAPGDFVWNWGIPAKGRPVAEDLTVTWPDHCETRGQALRCGTRGLAGTVSVEGVGQSYSAVILRIGWASGRAEVHTLTDALPRVRLFGGAQDALELSVVAESYGVLGVEHILTGWDHLLFVIGLLLLVGFRRQLVATITAFTVAHSLTLAASALGWLTLRSAPVEAAIALSIVLVCGEALRTRETLSRRWPALVALLFGLVHGLGFAGALREIGLPQGQSALALLSFNLGVEAGQLLVIGVAWLLMALWSRLAAAIRRRRAGSPAGEASPGLAGRRTLTYAIGGLGAFWLIERVAAIVF